MVGAERDFRGRKVISENGMNGRLLQTRRRRLKLKLADLAQMMYLDADAINRVENCMPYINTRNTIVRLDDVLTRFETADIQTLIKDYLRAEAENNPHTDYDSTYGKETAEKMRVAIYAHHRIIQQLKRVKEPPMVNGEQQQLYVVTYENGDTQEEYGADEADVRDFISRCFKFKGPIKSVELYKGAV